ncbi:hypothetical protein QNJ25_00195 [Macrococcus caseolyticus]|uniref:hypothetical protein n=1 Tax=Macrococcoides caseolyticum TaxID=69966 RepID=UPI0024BCD9CD|nr:hypothetical protein [Macrococcus caseolyticus]MDJ1152361.1 hypothetical protein [Macrococcus caseolyticus]
MTVNKGYFDTNIFVGISLLRSCELFFSTFSSVKVAQKVAEEFEKWNVENFSYRFIYTDAKTRIYSNQIEVINNEIFSIEEQQYIDYVTNEIKNGINDQKDLGEIHSVIMAQLHNAPYFCTNDNKFIKNYKDRYFSELETKDFRYVLNMMHEDDDEVERYITRERKENQKMVNELKGLSNNDKYKNHNGFEDYQLKILADFKERLSE